jgi:hypothetical protein
VQSGPRKVQQQVAALDTGGRVFARASSGFCSVAIVAAIVNFRAN